MYIKCSKCKDEQYEEGLIPENNPSLITCRNPDCGHTFFIEIKFKYKKAYRNSDNTYTTEKSEIY